MERPTVLNELVEAVGGEAVDFPYATECCGSYQVVSNPEFAAQRAREILGSAARNGADSLVLSCPLCHFNLSQHQPGLVQRYSDFTAMPILYFTQLLALAFGIEPAVCHFELDGIDPLPLLRSKELVP